MMDQMTGLKKSFDLLIKAFKAYKGSSHKGSSYKDTMGDPGIARMGDDGEAVVKDIMGDPGIARMDDDGEAEDLDDDLIGKYLITYFDNNENDSNMLMYA